MLKLFGYLRRNGLQTMLVAVAIAACAAVAAGAPSFDPGTYLHAQRLVDIGGRKLNIYCSGSGSPTVILEEGLGGSTTSWRLVQSQLARTTRVCSYDRAGMGYSDAASTPRDAGAVVSDLHALLGAAGVAPPYVIAGHSIAGLYIRLYADRYPSEVAGLVFVDPVFPYEEQKTAEIVPAYAKGFDANLASFKKCEAAAASHTLSLGNPSNVDCGYLDAGTLHKQCQNESPADCRIDELQNTQTLSPAFWAAMASEYEAFGGASSEEVEKEQRSYGTMPLIVLTRGHTDFSDAQTPISNAQQLALWKQLKAMHDGIASLSSSGVDVVVADSGHDIQIERPNVVISAVEKVVAQIRAAKS